MGPATGGIWSAASETGDVLTGDTPDTHFGPTGTKGIGEIGIVGAAAIANAVFHATGRRIRSLPITIDQLI